MNDLAGLVSFSAIPMLMVAAFSLVIPGMGAALSLRNEIMLALALPSVANAGMALGLLIGIDADNGMLLFLFATGSTLALLLPFITGGRGTRTRELRLAGLFAGGQVLSMLFTSLSPRAHAHIAHLLNGEVMAAGKIETTAIAAGCAGLLTAGILLRTALYSWCADEPFFRTGTSRYRLFALTLYTLITATVTVGVATVGPLLVTALMVFPALLGDIGKKGIDFYAIMVMAIGLAGSVFGFLCARAFDLPPAVCAAAGVGAAGGVVRLLGSTGLFSG
jgi:ABC-type Mn2+/Zn2+ transport system permease subunit